jgi:hypothetical protein
MALKINHEIICPHCGSRTIDEELCQVCGKFIDGDILVQEISLRNSIGKLFSRMQKNGFQGIDDVNGLTEDPWSDPGWSTLNGNLFNHDDD